jgi:hypothetical protein
MHCPNCGTQASADQKFCRSCGIGLQAVSQALAKELTAAGLDQPAGELSEIAGRIKKFERWGTITGLSGAGIIALMIIAIVVSTPFVRLLKLNPQFFFENIIPWFFALALPLFFAGAGLLIYASVLKKHPPRQPLQSPTLPQADTASNLPPASYHEPVHSIAEHTTDLLTVTDPKTERRN